jgi:hypothetical protein
MANFWLGPGVRDRQLTRLPPRMTGLEQADRNQEYRCLIQSEQPTDKSSSPETDTRQFASSSRLVGQVSKLLTFLPGGAQTSRAPLLLAR